MLLFVCLGCRQQSYSQDGIDLQFTSTNVNTPELLPTSTLRPASAESNIPNFPEIPENTDIPNIEPTVTTPQAPVAENGDASEVDEAKNLDIDPTEQLLEDIAQRAFDFFWQETNPDNGLIKDRANNFSTDSYDVSSIAAIGFGLTSLCVAKEHGWITENDAYDRAHTTLLTFANDVENVNGWFYHFLDMETGQRVWESEASSIDTALFLAGALSVAQCFPGTEVEVLANIIYERVDFMWMLTDGGSLPDEQLLGHGWKPETGFLPYRWDQYSEHMILYILALGSPTHPIPSSSWEAWERQIGTYAGYTTFAQGPLFTHQFSHVWIDFRNMRDSLRYDYFESSVNATLANRQFAIDNIDACETYDENVWGLTASDGPDGYMAYGAPPGTIVHDCTIAPSASASSIVFTPELSIAALETMYELYEDEIWGRYGFSDAFNVDRAWWDTDIIGIDQGNTLLMIENYRNNGFVWQTFMSHPAVRLGLQKAGFTYSIYLPLVEN
ncbi:glucoamylase family protein [Candidatus Leptofilum sp.]|uniref:glucoamylase family protein n=1 Tax=Candidatus Leptofilum sp. TaxID=3241576 RepID=UPI003B5A5947